jgi:hypothetical protein
LDSIAHNSAGQSAADAWSYDVSPPEHTGARTPPQPADSDALNWCLRIGEIVLRSRAAQSARSPSDALARYVAGEDAAAADPDAPRLFKEPDIETLSLSQRIDRLGVATHRSRAEIIDWAVCIGMKVLSDPAAGKACSPPDALAAHVLHAYVVRNGSNGQTG